MAQFSKMEVGYDDEASFAEASTNITKRIPVRSITADPQSDRSNDLSLQNRMAESRPGYLMPRSCKLDVEVTIPGAMVDTATGALSSTWFTKLLGDGWGGIDTSQVGGTASAGSTATSLVYAGATIPRGGIVRVGKHKDGRCEGQACVVGNPNTSPATLLTALPAAPNAADVIRAALLVYFTETMGASKRFMWKWDVTGGTYIAQGCHLERINLKLPLGDVPQATLSYQCAWWERLDGVSFNSGLTLEDCKASVAAGGSVFLNRIGTATRATVAKESSLDISVNTKLVPQMGQGGRAYQPIVGFERIGPNPSEGPFGTVTMDMPFGTLDGAGAAYADAYLADGSDSSEYHMLATWSAGDGTAAGEGRHLAIRCPRLYLIGKSPTWTNYNGLTYQTVQFGMREGTDTTNDRTRAAIMLAHS